jgi:hypothetical protein
MQERIIKTGIMRALFRQKVLFVISLDESRSSALHKSRCIAAGLSEWSSAVASQSPQSRRRLSSGNSSYLHLHPARSIVEIRDNTTGRHQGVTR